MNDHVSPISVVSAGAGTGKTWRLSSEYVQASHLGTSPARIIATTFTVKAAAELIERVRTRLIQEGFPDDAQRALAGLVGTVNSVCGRLVADFAVDGGLSPIADVIPPEMADALFAMATEEVIQKFSPDLDPVAQRLCQDDWRKIVSKIVGAARASGIQAASFADCANRSWRGLAPLLAQKATETPEQIDAALVGAIRSCVGQIEAGADSTVKSAKVLEDLRRTLSRFSNGRPLPWDDWARLSKLNSAKASQSFVESVVAQASRHPTHPRLHDDLERFITQVFACAAEALERFSEFKRDRGLIDFADQEALALELLRRPEVRERLGEWFDLLMVDEFQDTSPIQLAVFLEVAKAVKKSLWVGDQKQAIFGFRQTDPALVNAVIEVIRPATSGTDESLDTSRRSRPELVRFANALFGAAFPPKGVPKERVMIPNVHRREPSGFGPALNHWTIAGKNWSDALEALADRIRSMLAAPEALKVVDRADGGERALRPSDIAILCRQNQRCKAVADALGQLGIPSAMHRDALLETPEARLAIAALRYLVDPEDSLAIAELAHFNEGNDDWLSVWLTEGRDVLMARCPAIASLEENRLCLAHLTPVEALQSAIAAAKIDQLVRRWGRPGERLANLDALVKAGRQYEDSCRASRGAATAGGLVAYFAKGIKDGGERPAFEGDDSVRVLTYHKAKGLEWPMVILLDLQEETKGSPFGVFSESPPDGLDPWNPLVGRWVRLWPWPYGKQEKNLHLDRTAAASPEATARTEAELAELVRLLYVGVTRARLLGLFLSIVDRVGLARSFG
jgi:ATP-dependent helicase/nuclease subunit A